MPRELLSYGSCGTHLAQCNCVAANFFEIILNEIEVYCYLIISRVHNRFPPLEEEYAAKMWLFSGIMCAFICLSTIKRLMYICRELQGESNGRKIKTIHSVELVNDTI